MGVGEGEREAEGEDFAGAAVPQAETASIIRSGIARSAASLALINSPGEMG